MKAGKKVEWDELELRIFATGTYSRSSDVPEIRIGGSVRSEWTPSNVETRTGILINAVSILAGSATIGGSRREYNLSIPDLLVNINKIISGFSDTVDSKVIIEGLRVYAVPYAFITKWDNLKWYVEGELEFEYGSLEFAGNRLTHSGIFLLGLLGTIVPTAGINPFPAFGDIIRSSLGFTAEVETEATKGWRFKKNGQWYEPEVALIYGSVPTPPQDCSIDFALGSVSADTTYDFSIKARSKVVSTANDLGIIECDYCPDGSTASPKPKYQVTQHINRGESTGGYVLLLPNLDKDVHLIGGDDYACIVYRGGLPRTSRVGFNSCCEYEVENCELVGDPLLGCNNFATSSIQVNPTYLRKIDVVRENNKSLLDPLLHTTYSPYQIEGIAFESAGVEAVLVDPGGCPVEPPDTFSALCLCFSEYEYFKVREKSHGYPSVQIPINIGAFSYFRHEQSIPMYVDYWGHPLWSFFCWFPNNRDTLNWKVNGAKVNSNDYWLLLRQQYADAQGYPPSVFPTSSKSKTRLDLISEPLIFSGFKDMVFFSFIETQSSWFSIHNFDVDLPNFGSVDTSEESYPRFSGTNCTLNFTASNIEVQPTASTCEVSFNMLSWITPPYVSPAICDKVNVDWENDNVNSIEVYAESQSGYRVLISDMQGTHSLPRELDSHYAGSYGQSFILSTGTDVAPNGLSSSTYSNPELSLAHSLIRGGGAYKIVFVITPTNPSNIVKLKYPFFETPETQVKVIPETSNTHAILYPLGAGLRYGQLKFWDETTKEFLFTPKKREVYSAPTALDYLCIKRLLYTVNGVTDGLDAEIQSIYDVVEGDTREDLSQHTLSFPISYLKVQTSDGEEPLDGRYILVNSFRECPPLVSFPLNKRNDDLTFNTTELSHEVFSISIEPKRYISAEEESDLTKPDDTIITSTSPLTIPAGWSVTEHKVPVNNSESGYKVKQNGEQFGSFNNWHGCFLILSVPDITEGDKPRLSVHKNNRQTLAYLRSDDSESKLTLGYAGGLVPTSFSFKDHELIVKEHAIDYDDRSGNLLYAFVDNDDEVKLVLINEGVFSMPITVNAIGDNVSLCCTRHGLTFVYYSDGTNLFVKVYDAQLQLVQSEQTNIVIDEFSSFDVDEFITELSEWRIGLAYINGGEVKYASSVNGFEFD